MELQSPDGTRHADANVVILFGSLIFVTWVTLVPELTVLRERERTALSRGTRNVTE